MGNYEPAKFAKAVNVWGILGRPLSAYARRLRTEDLRETGTDQTRGPVFPAAAAGIRRWADAKARALTHRH